MKYLPLTRLTMGMVLGQDIYDGFGSVLLKKHLIINEKCLKKLESWGFPGVYIDDEFSSIVEIETIIRPEIQKQALEMTSQIFSQSTMIEENEEKRIREIVEDLVNEIISDGDIMYNLMNLRCYDNYTYFHSLHVAMVSILVGIHFGMEKEALQNLATAALLHDIGKKVIDIELLNSKRPLSDDEKLILLQHPKKGYEFLKDNFNFAPEVAEAVWQHHESYNGKGYPRHLAGDKISFFARIIKVSDVYDAMTSNRPYRKALSPSAVMEYIMSMNGMEFDPLVDRKSVV